MVLQAIRALWFLAGAAMMVFTAFLLVLVVAAVIFRSSKPNRRRNSTAVFALSTVLVVLVGSALLTTGAFNGDGEKSETTRTVAGSTPARTVAVPQPRVYPALAGMPLHFAKGGGSGEALSDSKTRALVLYGDTGAIAGSAELDATKLVNLLSHFGGWAAHPVRKYKTGEIADYDAVFYLGAADGEELPATFLHDVVQTEHPVMWINGDLTQLTARTKRFGFQVGGRDTGPFKHVEYDNTSLPMNQVNEAGLTKVEITKPAKASVLAEAVRADGTSLPWAVRSGNLTYLAEDPLPYIGYDNDRYLAFADLLFGVLAPKTAERHRALVRLEDVGPATDPAQLRAIVDYLAGQNVPFSIAAYAVYRDPAGVSHDGQDTTIRLSERPELVSALRYAVAHGGTVVMHGYTHQYSTVNNPVNGQSGDDAEFYLVQHRDQQFVPLGPVPEDSQAWALDRVDQGLAEFAKAGVAKPTMFEFPHYMASPVDYMAVAERFDVRYERSFYFPGLLSGGSVDDSGRGWQFFPYAVRDVYGATVVPENLDYVVNADSVTRMLGDARANLVVRDGVASFFYHPFLGLGELPALVSGIRAMGYKFVGAADLVAAP